MEFIDKNKIKTAKVINELDKFVFKFIKILEKHAKYVIVSGYVSIFFGRSRATEDVDIIAERLNKESFIKLYEDLKKDNFWCVKNHPSGVSDMLRSRQQQGAVFDARNSTNDRWFSSTTHSTNRTMKIINSQCFNKSKRLVEFRCLNAENQDEVYEYLWEHAVRFAIKDKVIPNIEFKFAKTESDKEALNNTITVLTTEGKLVMGSIEMQIAFKRSVLCSEKDIEDALHLEEVFKDKLDMDSIKEYEKWFRK